MSYIHLTTFISAPRERVFDLSRSVDLHKSSMKHHEEQIINGVLNGLMNLNDDVTWKAKHLLKERILKIKITEMQRPDFFCDEQLKGDFLSLKHEHYFKTIENGTIMIDQFRYELKKNFIMKLVDRFYLEKYMRRLLEERNAVIKSAAEGNQWKQFLS
ncbi:MAG TPA: SRPBCC family protein [Flavisolibacter sp.]|nr:SRPBCC family protein [Flavisolibacter sp.]